MMNVGDLNDLVRARDAAARVVEHTTIQRNWCAFQDSKRAHRAAQDLIRALNCIEIEDQTMSARP
jgi:hypothetical protein